MSLNIHLNVLRIVFSLHFCFLFISILLVLVFSVMFLVVVISLSSTLSYVIFESLYRCINSLQCWQVLFLLFFILIRIISQRNLWDIINYAITLIFLFTCPYVQILPGPLQEWSRISYERIAQVVILLIRFLVHSFVLSSFLIPLRHCCYFFLNLQLFDDVSLQDVHVFVGFLFSGLVIFS